MNFEITSKFDIDEWHQVANESCDATFFHHPTWFSIFSETYPTMKVATKKFIFKDGKVVFFPLIQLKGMKGLIKRYYCSPAGCYGGWVCSDQLTSEQISELLTWVEKSLKNITWRINPLCKNKKDITDHFKTKEDSTEILYLNNFKDENSLKSNYRYSVRKQINKGVEAGLHVKVATSFPEWEKYYEIYQINIKRWGDKATNCYPIDLFRNIYNKNSPSIKLWLVKKEKEIIGGNLNFYHNNHCVEWHAAFNTIFFKQGSRNFLAHHIILDALKSGYEYYDFNPSGGHEMTKKFKQTFGTKSVSSNVITLKKIPVFFSISEKIYKKIKML